ncbi:tetratricopeptide repeat protein [Algoriphagus sp. D3-2-R+10]|uniref:tetratricopeptide repeat protein n=1 Tax=Algoriphagus aurantiacus TaxID=3103948 RepID=UPI002B3B78E2|nr:tetratricopeptide repeat protein [Algoriphagus sp. D3-2-R+10]MEB2776019.1 tetratricopeptide repeat protein [Algoriphagus sp. D3-2-R+10]
MNLKRTLLIFLLVATSSTASFAQDRLSKKERKAQLNESQGTRYFIEGEKNLVLDDLEKAFFYFQKALEFSPEEPAIHYKIAEILVKANQAEKAMPYAVKAAELDNENKYYSLMLAEIYTNLKQPLKAADILEKLTAGGENNQQYNLDLASIYLNAGELDKALIVLDRAEEFFGVMEPITIQKQRIYLNNNNLSKAIAEGQKLVEARPGNPAYVMNLVEILYNNNRVDQALELVNGEINKYPNQPELQMAAHTLLKDKGKIEESKNHLYSAFASPDLDPEVKSKAFLSILNEIKTQERDALLDSLESLMTTSSPENAEIYAVLGERRIQENKPEEGINYFKNSLLINPKNAKLLEQVILGSFGENADFKELEQFTILGVDEFPQNPEFWFYDGVVKSAQKKDDEAVKSLNKAIELNANKNPQLDQVAFGSLGSSLYNLGEKEEAFRNFDKALELNPNDEQVLNNYSYFLSLEKKDLDKAKTMSYKVVTRFPDNGTFLDTHAWVLFQLEDYEGAKKFMDLAMKHETKPSAVMLEHYGDILFHLGKKNEALSYWKKAEGSPEASDKLSQKIKEGKYHE